MDLIYIIAQVVGLLAMTFNILSYQQKTRERAIAFQLCGGGLFAVNFLLLGATTGAILNVIAVIRAIVFLQREKFHANHPAWLIGFIGTYFASYGITFTLLGKDPTFANLIIELIPVIGMTATTLSFRLTDAKAIRRYGLISSPSWLIYNLCCFSVGAIICEVLSLFSIVIGMLRLDKQKETFQN
jgi:hypothetical protein